VVQNEKNSAASGSEYVVRILCGLWTCGCNRLCHTQLHIRYAVEKYLVFAPKSGVDILLESFYLGDRRRSKGLVQIMLASPK